MEEIVKQTIVKNILLITIDYIRMERLRIISSRIDFLFHNEQYRIFC
ncbi:MAG: hypothetical protein KatS3mg035_0323 [Bacteroidia bacterium]|nr:MAG: hypothetical protein KatS3mg035_0323 [Bacteroidia bacterium]